MKLTRMYLLSSLLLLLLLPPTMTGIAKEEVTSLSLNETSDSDLALSWITHDPIEIASNGDFDTSHGVVSGTGNWNEPYIIENWNITVATGHGIYIHDTTVHFVIRGCLIDAGTGDTAPYTDSAIFLNNTADGTALIEDNTCLNSYVGILICNANDTSLVNNFCDGNEYGISLLYANGHLVANNEIINSQFGLHLYDSSNCDLENNICDLISLRGIFIGTMYGNPTYNNLINNTCTNSNYGITISSTGYNYLANNTCSFNFYGLRVSATNDIVAEGNNLASNNYGIYLTTSSDNTITNNVITDSTSYGLYLDATSGNSIIHHNQFLDSGESPQASDDSTGSLWYDTLTNEGNYWSDYSGSGDYLINGTAGSVDPYPNNFIPATGLFHGAIEISYDSEFDEAHGVSSGSGTALDPYIIENWGITVATGHGIFIQDTTAYFIIRNCYIDAGVGGLLSDYDSSIYLKNIAEGTAIIKDNTCFSSKVGIFVYQSNGNIVVNNKCSKNNHGILLIGSSFTSVENNTCNVNKHGIDIGSTSFNNSIVSNLCISNEYGIILQSCIYNLLENNICDLNIISGIFLYYNSNVNVLLNNTCTNSEIGIRLMYSHNNPMINNTCNSNSFSGFWLAVSDENELVDNICNSNTLYGIFLNGSSDDNLLESNTCDWNLNSGIFIFYSDYNTLIDNSCNFNVYYGIIFSYTNYNNLVKNKCDFNGFHGIDLYYSNFSYLISNECKNNTRGISLGYSTNNTLNNNTCLDGEWGISISSSYNYIINNYCANNYRGIAIASDYNLVEGNTLNFNHFGILIFSSSNNLIVNNKCTNSTSLSIYLSFSDNNTIIYNLIADSVSYGVYLDVTSDNNIIHHNNFIDNGESPQAYDDGQNNQWYDDSTNEGNFWSDFTGTSEFKLAALGEYQIAGSAGSVDPYPLGQIVVIPELINPTLYAFIVMLGVISLGLLIQKRK